MGESYLKIGSYTPETEDQEAVIDRGYYRQDFLAMCNGQEEFAAECFGAVDWQAPETWIDEQYRYNEWGWCEHCEQIYAMDGESRPCPKCGAAPSEDEGEQNEYPESKC